MPDIRLQDYVVKIKDMIGDGRYDEAISHCQHILKEYPKFIQAYRLLGEACLEKGSYREAIEFFQRTLSADPENFIARVGLGIIYGEQGAIPEAIWQMERAFELAPGNAEVRRELQRLYAQRDGSELPRLKLSRGALGRLYARNGLYERAIGEFRAVLRQESDLPDIRVALLEALWHERRQRIEAVDHATALLNDLPFCLKANLILGEIWLRGGNEEAAEEKLKLANALDPENLVAHEMMGQDSPLPLQQVFISELEYTPEAPDLTADGLTGGVVAGVGAAVAAWDQVAGSLTETPALQPAAEEERGTREEMPDWLLAMEIEEQTESLVEGEAAPAEAMPDWLQELVGEEGEAVAPPLTLGQESDRESIPDWLRELEPSATGIGEMTVETPPEEPTLETAEVPDWLRELEPAAGKPPAAEAPPPPLAEEPTIEAAEIPAWLRELEPAAEEGAVVEEAPAPPEVEAPPAEAEAEIPDSLKALAAAGLLDEADLESAMAEMSPEELEAQKAEAVPDWLQDLMAVEEGVAPEAAEAPAPPVEEAAVVEEVVVEEIEAPPAEAEAEVPAWLRESEPAAEEGAVVEEAPAPPEVEEPVIAEAAAEVVVPAQEPPTEEPASPAGLPPWLREFAEEPAEPAAEEPAEALPPWLREVETEEPAEPEAEKPSGAMPDWLRDLGVDELETRPPTREPEPFPLPAAPAEDMPAWLREFEAAEEEPLPVPAATAPTEIEAWLAEEIEVEEKVAAGEEAVVEPEPPVIVPAAPSEAEARLETAVVEEEETTAEAEPEIPPVAPEPSEAAPPAEEPVLIAPFDRVEVEEAPAAPSRLDALLDHLAAKPRDYRSRLEVARLYRDEGNLDESLSHYEKLISARKHLPAVAEDLEGLIGQDVDQVRVYQLLGDAYMQQDQLDRALEMYRQARKALAKR